MTWGCDSCLRRDHAQNAPFEPRARADRCTGWQPVPTRYCAPSDVPRSDLIPGNRPRGTAYCQCEPAFTACALSVARITHPGCRARGRTWSVRSTCGSPCRSVSPWGTSPTTSSNPSGTAANSSASAPAGASTISWCGQPLAVLSPRLSRQRRFSTSKSGRLLQLTRVR